MSSSKTENTTVGNHFEDQIKNIHFKITTIMMVPMSIIIFVLNFPLVIYIVMTPKLRVPAMMFVLCLGCTDISVGILCLSKAILKIPPNYHVCLIRTGYIIGMISSSAWYFFLIAFDRLISIVRPFDSGRRMSLFRAFCCIGIVFTYSILMGIAPLWGWAVSPAPSICSIAYVADENYIICSFITAFVMPLVATIIIYTKIFSVTRRHIRKISILESSILLPAQRHKYKTQVGMFFRTMKAIKMLAITIGCFLFTWGPFMLANLIEASGYDCTILRDTIGTYLLLLGISNAVLNPVIYVFWNREFRLCAERHWLKLQRCCCQFRRKGRVASEEMFATNNSKCFNHQS